MEPRNYDTDLTDKQWQCFRQPNCLSITFGSFLLVDTIQRLWADGRYVAFRSLASNLVDGDTNGEWDIFVHDRETSATERVSVYVNGTHANNNVS